MKDEMLRIEVKNRKEYMKKYYQLNEDKIKEYRKEYNKLNKEKLKAHGKKYYKLNKDKMKEYMKEYHRINKEHKKEYDKEYCKLNKDNMKEYMKEYAKEYRKINRKKINEYSRLRDRTDPQFHIRTLLRNRLYQVLKLYTENGKVTTSKSYGINWSEVLLKLMATFPKDYETQKYHVDHIKPLCRFDLEDSEQIKIAFSPENHQWLTAEENMRKGGKY